ncbi:hypothetical protein ABZ345_07650 [Lentzea sp. NPDC005914]|uniref:hypothetical protein n=1 Tax=Lentzea sp. NPDC005914 TaxID=3154572 RepID=UPI0033F99640
MNERPVRQNDGDDFEFTDEVRTHKKKVDEQIPISQGTPEGPGAATQPKVRGFRPIDPNE